MKRKLDKQQLYQSNKLINKNQNRNQKLENIDKKNIKKLNLY